MNFVEKCKAYFLYGPVEMIGLRIMIIFMIITLSFPYALKSLVSKDVSSMMLEHAILSQDSIKYVKKNYTRPIKKYTDEIIELNSADTNMLKKVRGLGSWYAKKIVRFRDRVGGFSEVSQLRDVKLHEGEYEKIYKQFTVDTSLIKRFDIDTISFKNLLRNPYFDYQTVKKIFNIKNEYRGLTPEFLLEQHAIDTLQYFKTRAYFIDK